MGRKIIENPAQCPITHAMNIMGGKWKSIIIYLLKDGSLRFGKLNLFLPGISKKVLTEQLKELENDGLINRERFAEIPPRVEYSLTEKSRALLPILEQLATWSREEVGELTFQE